jgi:hypothetical protein
MAQHRTDHGHALYSFAGRHGPTVSIFPPKPAPPKRPPVSVLPSRARGRRGKEAL